VCRWAPSVQCASSMVTEQSAAKSHKTRLQLRTQCRALKWAMRVCGRGDGLTRQARTATPCRLKGPHNRQTSLLA
jgi:hypothetical protein